MDKTMFIRFQGEFLAEIEMKAQALARECKPFRRFGRQALAVRQAAYVAWREPAGKDYTHEHAIATHKGEAK